MKPAGARNSKGTSSCRTTVTRCGSAIFASESCRRRVRAVSHRIALVCGADCTDLKVVCKSSKRSGYMSGRLTRVARAAGAAAAISVMCSGAAYAQAVSGTLLGTITDPGGLAMPGVAVTITETSTNISFTATTNESGFYTFPSLKDGTYKVVAELTGFKKVLRDGIIVPVNTTIRVDLRMEVGALEESITVVGQSPVLQTDRTDTGRLIESKMVSEMPLTFNRNFQSILITVPGSTRPHREHSAFFN